jgi:hypothetical protein
MDRKEGGRGLQPGARRGGEGHSLARGGGPQGVRQSPARGLGGGEGAQPGTRSGDGGKEGENSASSLRVG